jgi:hypothetical protein
MMKFQTCLFFEAPGVLSFLGSFVTRPESEAYQQYLSFVYNACQYYISVCQQGTKVSKGAEQHGIFQT